MRRTPRDGGAFVIRRRRLLDSMFRACARRAARAASGAIASTSSADATLVARRPVPVGATTTTHVKTKMGKTGTMTTTTTTRTYASSPSPRAGANKGPVGWLSLLLVSATGAGCLYFYDAERARRVNAAREGRRRGDNGFQTRVAGGRASVGGDFTLVDAKTGKRFDTAKDLRGRFALLYFGFTHCPDVCPDELEKVAEVVNATTEARRASGATALVPVFITIDPQRDDRKRVAAYVEEFHPTMIGLVGSEKACGDAARKYRVYYRKTGDERATEDYLVDHSIITYLIDPNGDFVTFYGKNTTAEEVSRSVLEHMRDFDEGRGVAAVEAAKEKNESRGA